MADSTELKTQEIVERIKRGDFDIDKALNTKGFAEFQAAHPESDKFDMEDGEAIRQRFEVFETKTAVSKELKQLYSGHIEKEMGIKLDAKDLSSIDAHLENQAINSPEEFMEIKERLDAFRELPLQISALEKQLAELGGVEELKATLEGLQKDEANLETAQKYKGIIGKTKVAFQFVSFAAAAQPLLLEVLFPGVKLKKNFLGVGDKYNQVSEALGSLSSVKEKFGKMGKKDINSLQENIGDQIHGIENVLASVQQIDKLKSLSQEMFGNMRKELLGGVSDITGLTESIQAKAMAQFKEIVKSGSTKSLDQAQERFEALRSVAVSTETGVNPLGGINEEEFQKRVDAGLEKAASEEIMQTLMRANLGSNALTKLEKSLEPFLNREKIGSKEGEEAREFIANALKEAADNLGNTTEDKAKKSIVARILIKMKA